MLSNYFKLILRNLRKHTAHSFINIAGLSIGMTVALLIGTWIWDELSFDHYHKNHQRIAAVMQHLTFNGKTNTGGAIPYPLAQTLRNDYGNDFKYIVLASWTEKHVLSASDKNVSFAGNFMQEDAPDMLTLDMIKGDRHALGDPTAILISQSAATAIFGGADPTGKTIKIDNTATFAIRGVYKDLPNNTTFHSLDFIGPWEYYKKNVLSTRMLTDWADNSLMLYTQISDRADMQSLSEKIRDIKRHNAPPGEAALNPRIFLEPMARWHLHAEYKNGINTGGAIQYVWLFGIIGVFVLLLACINFMNLSTARSEKRAREVGVRKAVGSLRSQLIVQFFVESLTTAALAFIVSLILTSIFLQPFNQLAGKSISMPWSNPVFWCCTIGFTILTGLIAGSYPAFYLSSFQPVKVLKGTFKAGRQAAIPRQVLVVLQFSFSVILIIGTIVIFKQIQYVRDRPVGYEREGLLTMQPATEDLFKHFEAFKFDVQKTGLIAAMAVSSSPATGVDNNRTGVSWTGKDPAMASDFASIRVGLDYGRSVGWKIIRGRDFSKDYATDSLAVVINEAAVNYMGLKDPLSATVQWGNKQRHIIGVIKDMIMQSPYTPAKQSIFFLTPTDFSYINVRIAHNANPHEAIESLAAIAKTYAPAEPFTYKFADAEYARKFRTEERIGKLAATFSVLAIFISCLGLFGMATFMAEQRTKEIGIRKVLGASVFNLWGQLSKDFIMLIAISLLIAIPTSYLLMTNWLNKFQYHSNIPWWIFALTAVAAIGITLLTVSYQSIKAALMNPVNSLRSE